MTPQRPATPNLRPRTIRVPDDLWEAFSAVAEAEGTTVSAMLRAHMRRVVNRRKDEQQ